ncbi:hypothetical protein GCK72_025298 [Caenorhabditis remanei]|uniref:EF-hand domain-containing protein n=1 Tax=Caenorhabditis remanei TaxID=31234 RepID=A0A6A5G238_CAERE|nr:hypothetical protein GCK72_025298 [Caenorhabditis remanei]KAF1748831.1 hypothetical protein GCK72_025298 [Caenorhabditis remanei]
MKYVYLSLLVIFLVICLAYATDFEEHQSYDIDDHHDESIHDIEEDSGDNTYLDMASQFLNGLTKDDVKNHFKDIIRGFSDKGFEDCDTNNDKFLDMIEVECFVTDKMGYSMKEVPEKIVEYFDKDHNGKLDSDEVWNIVEDKAPSLFEILPSTVERNMELLHGLQQENGPVDAGAGIFY